MALTEDKAAIGENLRQRALNTSLGRIDSYIQEALRLGADLEEIENAVQQGLAKAGINEICQIHP